MKPYGKKPEKCTSKKFHTSECPICSNQEWKILKRRQRNSWKKELNEI